MRKKSGIALFLLEHGSGVDLAARDKQGWTALGLAAANNQPDTLRVLIEVGADVNALSAAGGTPLHEAAASGVSATAAVRVSKMVSGDLGWRKRDLSFQICGEGELLGGTPTRALETRAVSGRLLLGGEAFELVEGGDDFVFGPVAFVAEEFLALGVEEDLGGDDPDFGLLAGRAVFPDVDEADLELGGVFGCDGFAHGNHLVAGLAFVGSEVDELGQRLGGGGFGRGLGGVLGPRFARAADGY